MRSRLSRHLHVVLRTPPPDAAFLARTRRVSSEPVVPAPAPDRVPMEFNAHDYAIFLLQVAAEIEHALMVQYLYAGYSLGGARGPTHKRPPLKQWQDRKSTRLNSTHLV